MPKHPERIILKQFLPSILALACIGTALGDTRLDPTMPPATWSAAQAAAPLANTPGSTTAAAPSPDASSGLQLILIGPSRRFALIDGQVVKPGDTYNGSKVVAIKPDEVVAQDASKSVELTPGVKKVITSAPTRNRGGALKGEGPAYRSGDGK
ncbi:MAG: hypothetical protein JSS57_16085 [Proteobacteria bacterium]|nr:hypothetical protein [Pseudomonadota bacterium]